MGVSETEQDDGFEVRRRLLQLEMLYEVGLALNKSQDPHQVAREILDRALVMVDARCGLMMSQGEQDQEPGTVACAGVEAASDELEELSRLPLVQQAWKNREMGHLSRSSPSWCHLCALPLMCQEEMVGLLLVADKETRSGTAPFDDSDEALLRSFANLAGSVLHNARLHRHLLEAYDQLKLAQEKLAQLEHLRALGDLATELAHAMGHTLGIIVGRADMYLNYPKRPEETMKAILDTAEGGHRIIERLRRCTRLGVGTQRSALVLNDIVQRALDDAQMVAKQRQGSSPIGWETHLGPLPTTYANPTDVREVVDNLLVNAVEAMPEGGSAKVTTRLDGAEIELAVEDTGIGMPSEGLERLFEPFFSTKGEQGTGLGMSIAYRIVNDHGGDIRAESEVGKGTRINVRLPVVAEAPHVEEDESDVEADFDR